MTEGRRVAASGASLADAKAAVILLHGRGATAESILSLADVLALDDIAYVAPQAPGRSWYPYSFLAPLDQNEPHLSRSLEIVRHLVNELSAKGFGPGRLAVAGFSQGGCLGLEFAARNAQRYGGIIGLSAGLIGPKGAPRGRTGSLTGTPALLGCSDMDAHIPLGRVRETTSVLTKLGASVDERIYPGMGHTINADEIDRMRSLVARLSADAECYQQQRQVTS